MARPKKEESRTYVVNVRLDRDDTYRLNYLVKRTGKSRSEVIRDGIRLMYNRTVLGSDRVSTPEHDEDW